MALIAGVLCLFPLLTLVAQGRSGLKPPEALRVMLLFALGLGAASPFLTKRGLGTGDAFNYAHAVADGVTQLRAGVLPVYVGQSEYSFNGRVHPLRTAGYYIYASGLLDLLTRHRLGFWGLQNLLLAASLVGAAFSAYLCIRKLGTVGPWTALLLAGVYVLSPGLLAAAYSMDLYMTVTAAPYVPIVLLGVIRCFADRSFANLALAAIGLAACWLAHSPVALWLSLGCVPVLLAGLIAHPPRWRDLLVIPAATALGAALCAYGFVASGTIDPRLVSTSYERPSPAVVGTVMYMTKAALPGSLLPVSQEGNALGDFQLGYASWLLLGLAAWIAVRRRSAVAAAFGVMILFYFTVTTPVPWLHRKLWEYLPTTIIGMTNIWPMQRLYLLLSAAVIFMAALAWPRPGHGRWQVAAGAILVVAGLAWTGSQAWHFLRHGFGVRYSATRTAAIQRPENANLTVSAYAFLGYPSWFSHGPMDPEHGLRLLSPLDMSVIRSNWDAGGRQPPAAAGRLHVARTENNTRHLEPRLTLEPGKHYRLRFHFLAPRIDAMLHLEGETLSREQLLPGSVGPKGFGMDPGNNPALVLFTTSSRPEHVELTLDNLAATNWEWTDFADFTLEEIDHTTLPLQLVQLVPFLVCRFDSPQECWLETPRMYINGYTALVDGKPAEVVRSLESQVAVAVPAGKHTLELRYPGSRLLHNLFFLGLWSWVGVLAVCVTRWTWQPGPAKRAGA
jgi:hypothetical protein